MKRTARLAALALLVLAGLTACGDSASEADTARTDTAVSVSNDAETPAGPTEEHVKALVDLGYGGPPQTASMNCADRKTCDLVFVPPSDDVVRPFGLAVKLVRVEGRQVVISVAGQEYVVKPGKAVKVKSATVTLVGTPGSVVALTVQST